MEALCTFDDRYRTILDDLSPGFKTRRSTWLYAIPEQNFEINDCEKLLLKNCSSIETSIFLKLDMELDFSKSIITMKIQQ